MRQKPLEGRESKSVLKKDKRIFTSVLVEEKGTGQQALLDTVN